jgi:arylsulfatase A-like enzyme
MSRKPNVLCISIDSLRADFAPFISGEGDWTPSLSEVANSSTVYANAISPSIWTLPVHASVFTGLYPPEHGVIDKGFTLGSHPTFAELLEEHDYSAGWYGRNGWLKVGDILRGFDDDASSVDRIEDVSGSLGKIRVRVRDLLDSFSPPLKHAASRVYHNKYIKKMRQQRVLTDWLDKNTIASATKGIENAEEPFCMFVHLNDVHWPYKPPRQYARQYTDRSRIGVEQNKFRYQKQIYAERERYWAGLESPDDIELETMQNLYKGAIRYADKLLGDLLSSLDQMGKLKNTILIIFGDHGDAFGEDGHIGHHLSLADELIQVPLMIRDPTGQLPCERVTHPVQLNDLYPTILELCGVTPPKTNSISLINESRKFAFSHYTIPQPSHMEHFLQRVPDRKLPPRNQIRIWQSEDKNALYYPARDEYKIICGNGEMLTQELKRHQDALDNVTSNRKATISKDVEANLEDMGYI